MRTRSRAIRRAARGMAAVEMALVMVLLMMLTMGLVEYGWMFLKQQQIANVCRQAVRIGALPTGTNAAVNSQVDTMMTNYGLGSSGYSKTIYVNSTPDGNVQSANAGVDQIKVYVSVPYANIEMTHFTYLPMPSTLSAKVSMLKEGS